MFGYSGRRGCGRSHFCLLGAEHGLFVIEGTRGADSRHESAHPGSSHWEHAGRPKYRFENILKPPDRRERGTGRESRPTSPQEISRSLCSMCWLRQTPQALEHFRT